jgi:ABC-type Na+ transport system ATPase subunit NatA
MLQVFSDMTVLENIILAGQEHHDSMLSRLFGKPDAGLGAEAEQMIAFFQLSHLSDEKAGALSYGQQKLLDAAMAFMAGPRLVMLDEPAGGVNLTMLESLRVRWTFNAERATGDRIVFERYLNSMHADQPHQMKSVTKSFAGLFGLLAVADGKVKENDDEAAQHIINEVDGVSWVTYDISGKPPATIEWE